MRFPAKFKVPKDWDTIFNGNKERILFEQEAIEIKVELVDSQTPEDIDMTWKVLNFTEDFIEFKFNFVEPFKISALSPNTAKVFFWRTELFARELDDLELERGTMISMTLPG